MRTSNLVNFVVIFLKFQLLYTVIAILWTKSDCFCMFIEIGLLNSGIFIIFAYIQNFRLIA